MNYAIFLSYLHTLNGVFFIEAEAKPDQMNVFIELYNGKYHPLISVGTNGICLLNESVDKWGVELRIYINDISNMPDEWLNRKYSNRTYRADEFSYRIDDNALVYELFNNGYRIGYNNL